MQTSSTSKSEDVLSPSSIAALIRQHQQPEQPSTSNRFKAKPPTSLMTSAGPPGGLGAALPPPAALSVIRELHKIQALLRLQPYVFGQQRPQEDDEEKIEEDTTVNGEGEDMQVDEENEAEPGEDKENEKRPQSEVQPPPAVIVQHLNQRRSPILPPPRRSVLFPAPSPPVSLTGGPLPPPPPSLSTLRPPPPPLSLSLMASPTPSTPSPSPSSRLSTSPSVNKANSASSVHPPPPPSLKMFEVFISV